MGVTIIGECNVVFMHEVQGEDGSLYITRWAISVTSSGYTGSLEGPAVTCQILKLARSHVIVARNKACRLSEIALSYVTI